ncbi:hypothetical protein GJU40_16360 [Bacillus lacus]|uniref:Uncharacterized protein n=1 Tax=Metabacillus lacus TaxID=1983721 RepID=A0A7X2LYM0_9BACI|nr:hypothetical protein [Metabacillus lacus]MRX73715.1 hypothetical protein [Metabacillus lacus]
MGLLHDINESNFKAALDQVKKAGFPQKEAYRLEVLKKAENLLHSSDGMYILLQYAPYFDEAHLFLGRPWEDMQKLQPSLVRGTLEAGGTSSIFEFLSNLRLLAIALGTCKSETFSKVAAQNYLNDVVALNFDVLYPNETEEGRVKSCNPLIFRLFQFLSNYLSPQALFEKITAEIEKLSVQRPLTIDKILTLISSGRNLSQQHAIHEGEFVYYRCAATVSSADYKDLSAQELVREACFQRMLMNRTGIVSNRYVLVLIEMQKRDVSLLPYGLGLGEKGYRAYFQHETLFQTLLSSCLTSETRQALYGFNQLLERDIFSENVIQALKTLVNADYCEEARSTLDCNNEEVSRAKAVSGILHLLGMPLGAGQGNNPVCQSTRALSYWAQENPAYLLNIYLAALVKGEIEISYEDKIISSGSLSLYQLNHDIPLDPVSMILIPHLHAIYEEMLKVTENVNEDVHKWINPAFYGAGVLKGFASSVHHPSFLPLFYLHYHYYNEYTKISLPQPAGVMLKDRNERILGAHAVLIQRVSLDPEGLARVYFYNPNNDSKQTWGSGIETSVTGNGELPGESSLLFDQFASCLYAFHYPQ